jgi:hypothetical protein
VRERWLLPPLQGRSGDEGRNLALGEVDLFLRKTVEGRRRNAEVLGEQFFGRVADPVRDAEGAEFGEVAIVEDENKVARLIAQGFDDMPVTAREIPDVARLKVIGLAAALGGRSPWCAPDPR